MASLLHCLVDKVSWPYMGSIGSFYDGAVVDSFGGGETCAPNVAVTAVKGGHYVANPESNDRDVIASAAIAVRIEVVAPARG
jgi:hypothetical protein